MGPFAVKQKLDGNFGFFPPNCFIFASSFIHKPNSSIILAEYIVVVHVSAGEEANEGVLIPSRTVCSLVLVLSHVPWL